MKRYGEEQDKIQLGMTLGKVGGEGIGRMLRKDNTSITKQSTRVESSGNQKKGQAIRNTEKGERQGSGEQWKIVE